MIRALGVDLPSIRQTLNDALEKQKGKGAILLEDALPLIRAYQAEQVFPSAVPLATPLIDEDDRRRYIIDQDIPVRTADGATVCRAVTRRTNPRPWGH